MSQSSWRESATVPPAEAFVLGPVGAVQRRPARRVFAATLYFAFVLAWATLFLLLATSPETIDSVWAWFNDQHAALRVIGWVVLLPLTGAVAVWESFLPLAIRWVAVAVICFMAILAYAPKDE